jgi:hypothetical protein
MRHPADDAHPERGDMVMENAVLRGTRAHPWWSPIESYTGEFKPDLVIRSRSEVAARHMPQ